MTPRILVVDDDQALAEMINIVLSAEGYEVRECYDGEQVEDVFQEFTPDLILLDVMLPGLSGFEICERIRRSSNVPIVMLTARSDTADVVTGLEAGADDYVPKPFKPRELVARIKARLRGGEEIGEERLRLGDLTIDVAGHEVRRGDELLNLTPLEFDLLATLMRTPWKAFTREELLQKVWGYRHAADSRLVNVHVQRLRAKVETDPENPRLVVTVRGVGYRAGSGT